MFDTLITLTPISLLDSLSVVPMCIVPMGMMLAGKKPVYTTLAFLFGLFITYFPFGLGILFGLNHLFESLGAFFKQIWFQPSYLDVALEVLIGGLLLIGGYWLVRRRAKQGHIDESPSTATWSTFTPLTAFVLAVGFNVSGMWGAFPYFAAIDQLLRQNVGTLEGILFLLYYNIVFIMPLIVFIVVYRLLGQKAEVIFAKLTAFIMHWGIKCLALAFMVLGLVMMIDGVSILMLSPVFPVPDGFVFPPTS